MSLKIRRLSYALGAEIMGIDIRKPLDDKTVSELRAAFLQYCVLVFRGQSLTREQHIAFTGQFGKVDKDDKTVIHKVSEYPEIHVHNPKPTDTYEGKAWFAGMVWHTDRSFTLVPTMASLLRGVEIPEVGGNTMFANMYLAYESLSDGMKKLIEGLYGVYPASEGRIDFSTPERLAETKRLNPSIAQPLVSVHPETRRKSLYVGARVKQLVGMTAEESRPLLQFLCGHATRPQFVYRHQWQKDDLLMWDNRCTDHMAVGDYDRSQTRHMEKTAVVGTSLGGYLYEGPLQ